MNRRSRLERLRRLYLVGCAGLTVAWLLGQLAQTAPWPLDLLSYLPAAPIAVFLLIAAAHLRGPGRRRARWAALLGAGVLTVHVAVVDMAKTPPGDGHSADAAIGSYRLVQWNLFRDYLAWAPKIERLRQLEADVYVLNEVPRHVSRGETALRFGPGFTYAMEGALDSQMVIGCRGTVTAQSYETWGRASALWADCDIDAQKLRILAVDMPASPLEARRPLLEKLWADIEERRPDLVAGDFNTPRRAGLLRHPPAGYRHAFEAVGSGWPYSWPTPISFLAIDQCLFAPTIEALDLRYVSTWNSDHRLQIFDFAVVP